MALKPIDVYRVLAYVLSAAAVVVSTSSAGAERTVPSLERPGDAQDATSDRPPQETPQKAKQKDQRVSGSVLDRDGKAVAMAEVGFDGPKKEKVRTDGRGEFSFTGPAGDYVITVKAGERQQKFKVKIEDNQLKPSSILVIEPELLM